MPDDRKLEKTGTPGIYRRHAGTCRRTGRCHCPYVARWEAQGRSHRQFFPTFEQARQFKEELGSGKRTRRPLSSKTLADYYEVWLPNYRGRTARGLEETTRSGYETAFRHHILPLAIARIRMRDVGAPDVRDWLIQLERRGASRSTIQKAKAALSVMLASAVEDGDLSSNPAAGVRYVPSGQAKRSNTSPKRRHLTAEDIVRILDAMPEEWRTFFALLAQTGLRISELLGLTWEHVHLGDDPHLMVTEQVYRGERKKLKTDASRARVPLSAGMASCLASVRPADEGLTAPVFPSKTGTPLTYWNVRRRVLVPALAAAGLDGQGISFHSFRRACGSLLLASGKSPKQVQGWLRHSQLTTTMNVYIHQVDDGLGSADAWDEIVPLGGRDGSRSAPEGAESHGREHAPEMALQSQIGQQAKTAEGARVHS